MTASDARRIKAARSLAEGKSQATAARESGVNRSTIKRWLQDPTFQDLLLEQKELSAGPDALEAVAERGLGALVPQAIALLQQAITDGDVPAAKARVALDIVKAAATLDKGGGAEGVSGSLASIIERLDERGSGTD